MWQRIMDWFEDIGTARAAAELARQGRHDLAQKMILKGKK